jgi:hypothetical protein
MVSEYAGTDRLIASFQSSLTPPPAESNRRPPQLGCEVACSSDWYIE